MDLQKEIHGWGVEIIAKPFSETRPEVEIRVNINNPQNNRRPVSTVCFSGIPANKPLRLADMTAWRNAMTIILAEAVKTADAMMAKPSTKKKGRKRP